MKTRSLSFRGWCYAFGILLVIGLITGLVPHDALAQTNAILDPRDQPDAAVSSEIRDAVVGFINYFLGFLGLVAVAFVVYAGVLMVTSAGNDENTGKAKKILLWSTAGIVVVLLSWAIVRLIVGAGDAVA